MFGRIKAYFFPKKRILRFDDVYIPQVYATYGWEGINKQGNTWLLLRNQKEYCGLSSEEEAHKLLETMYTIPHPNKAQ